MDEIVIEFACVSLCYRPGNFALREISAAIARGSFVALVGASGSGKTSLLKTVNRLVEPTSGLVRVVGQDVRARDPAQLRRGIGYVFQGLGLFPHMSVAENVGVTPSLLGWSAREIEARVGELLALVDLPPDFAKRYPAELSGGQRQRVAVARALAARPPIMLMDEPFGALDPVTRDGLMTAVRDLHGRLGLTTVMVTHDMNEALLSADRILVMSQGRLVADGAPAELFGEEAPPEVAPLFEAPRRQAERLKDLLEGRGGTSHA